MRKYFYIHYLIKQNLNLYDKKEYLLLHSLNSRDIKKMVHNVKVSFLIIEKNKCKNKNVLDQTFYKEYENDLFLVYRVKK